MEAIDYPVDWLAVRIETLVTDAGVARHFATQTGNGQAALPAQFFVIAQGRDDRVDQNGLRHRISIRITLTFFESEDHQLQTNTNLRRRQANAPRRGHGVEHILDQLLQLFCPERHHRIGRLEKQRFAHAQDLSD